MNLRRPHGISRIYVVVTVLLVSCQISETEAPSLPDTGRKTGGRLTMSLDVQDITSLDPVVPNDNSAIWTILNLYDQLFRVASDGQSVEPDAVERYAVSADGLIYTFTMRDHLTFSEGTPVTVDDVVYSLQRMLASENWGWLFPKDATVTAVDSKTFQIILEQPNAPLINNLAGFWSSIIPRKSVEASGAEFWEKPISSGPFRVKEWVRGSHITLERNPHYWGKAPYLDEVELQLVTDDNTRMLKFQAGELDIATNVPYNQAAALDALEGISVHSTTLLGVDFIALNASRSPLNDVNVRLALNYATNKQAIIDTVLFGQGEEATTTWPKVLHWNDQLEGYPYNLELARELLRSSKAPDSFALTYTYRADSESDMQIGTLLQAQWAKIGVVLQLEPLEGGLIRERAFQNDFDVIKSYNSSDVIDPAELTAIFLCRFTRQTIGVCHPGIDRLYIETETMMDPAERKAAYYRLMQIANDWAVYIPLYYAPARTAVWDHINGYQILPTGNVRLWEVWLER
jgi:peptide/nickel transport system substrate-binding protein